MTRILSSNISVKTTVTPAPQTNAACEHEWFDCSNSVVQAPTKSCKKCGWTVHGEDVGIGMFIVWPWLMPAPQNKVIAVISNWIRLYIFLEAHDNALGKVFTAEEDDPVCEKERQSCKPYEPIAVAERPIHFSAAVAIIDLPNRFDCAALHHQSGCFDGFGQPVHRLAAQCQEIGKACQQLSPKLLRQILTDTISKLLLPFVRPHSLTPLKQTLRRAGEQSFADVAKAYSAPAPQPREVG